jgi:hypothetical protein
MRQDNLDMVSPFQVLLTPSQPCVVQIEYENGDMTAVLALEGRRREAVPPSPADFMHLLLLKYKYEHPCASNPCGLATHFCVVPCSCVFALKVACVQLGPLVIHAIGCLSVTVALVCTCGAVCVCVCVRARACMCMLVSPIVGVGRKRWLFVLACLGAC